MGDTREMKPSQPALPKAMSFPIYSDPYYMAQWDPQRCGESAKGLLEDEHSLKNINIITAPKTNIWNPKNWCFVAVSPFPRGYYILGSILVFWGRVCVGTNRLLAFDVFSYTEMNTWGLSQTSGTKEDHAVFIPLKCTERVTKHIFVKLPYFVRDFFQNYTP